MKSMLFFIVILKRNSVSFLISFLFRNFAGNKTEIPITMKKQLIIYLLMLVPIITMGQNRYQDNINKAEQGDAEAQFEVGKAYSLGEGVEKNLTQAIAWYKKSAAKGNVKAQNNLGVAYKFGEGVEKDLNEAMKWLKKSAEGGNPLGMYNLATCYWMKENYKKAFEWMEKAAANNSGVACYQLGKWYAIPYQEYTDTKKSFDSYKKGAELGHTGSQVELAQLYRRGSWRATDVDLKKALYWLEQVIANGDDKQATEAANDASYIRQGHYGGGPIVDLDEALRYADIAIEKSGGRNADYYDSKGDAYWVGLEQQNRWYGYKGNIDDWFKNFDPLKAYEYYNGVRQMLAKCKEVDPSFFLKKETQFYKNARRLEQNKPKWLNDKDVLAVLQNPSQTITTGTLAQQTTATQQKTTQQPVAQQPVVTQQPVVAQQPKPVIPQVVGVDVNIPATAQIDKNTFAVIIGNEKYEEEADVPFAENDARIFYEYCKKTLGISEKHIRLYINAGFNDIRKAVSWLKQGLAAYGGQGRVIFYYAGHGIPNEADKGAYLLPVDGVGSDIESAYSLNRLYQTLSELPAQRVSVFLDACFSGAKRDGQMLASARGVAIKAKPAEAKGKMVVFSAATGDETAYPFKSQQHGMFTYYLLKKLQETKGDVTLGDLGDYLTNEVKRSSFDENSKIQTPTVIPSAALTASWRTMKLK